MVWKEHEGLLQAETEQVKWQEQGQGGEIPGGKALQVPERLRSLEESELGVCPFRKHQ